MTCHKVTNDEFIMAASTIFAVASTGWKGKNDVRTSERGGTTQRSDANSPITLSHS